MRTVVALLLGLSSILAAQTNHPAQVSGIYEGTVVVKNADGRKVTLNLRQDGAAELRDGGKTSAGHWTATGQDLRVKAEGASAPMLWKIRKNTLVLQGAGKAEYGKKGLTLRRPR